MIWLIAGFIFMAGCAGGFVNALVSGELKLPAKDQEAGVFRPGWIGIVLVGGAAATVSWRLYGPLAEMALLGGTANSTALPILRVSEFFGGLIVGFGGGRWLTSEVDRSILAREKESLTTTRDDSSKVIQILTETIKGNAMSGQGEGS